MPGLRPPARNGKAFEVDTDPDKPLPWARRAGLARTGRKFGCGESGATAVANAPFVLTGQRLRALPLRLG